MSIKHRMKDEIERMGLSYEDVAGDLGLKTDSFRWFINSEDEDKIPDTLIYRFSVMYNVDFKSLMTEAGRYVERPSSLYEYLIKVFIDLGVEPHGEIQTIIGSKPTYYGYIKRFKENKPSVKQVSLLLKDERLDQKQIRRFVR